MQSMTGFGTAKCESDNREVVIELKSVNHRFLDVSLKLPKFLSFLESDFRKALTNRLDRGHIDIYITYKNSRDDSKIVEVDIPLLKQYSIALNKIENELCIKDMINYEHIFKMSGVLNVSEQEDDQQCISKIANDALNLAITSLIQMRANEGINLKKDINDRVNTLKDMFENIKEFAPEVPKYYSKKLEQRMTNFLNGAEYDDTRLITEVAVFADKCNIDEEITRFTSHINQFESTLELDGPIGKKLDFTLQEINREINTIGSKANYANITNCVVDIKAELEKIREQVQNIE